jgi:hypothetical protein
MSFDTSEAGASIGSTVNHLLASGEVLPSQLPSVSSWSPEKKLAAAVLTSALICIRDHYGDEPYAEVVEEDLAWVASDDMTNGFSFLQLCEIFELDAAWVREVVERWKTTEKRQRRPFSLHRHAA